MRNNRFTKDQSAASAVEFALLVPVFLLLIMGALAYGIYFGAAHSVQQIAADAARYAVAGLSTNERRQLVETYISQKAGDYPLLDIRQITVSAAPKSDDANQFIVTVRYDASHLPIWNLDPNLLPSKNIDRVASIRNGGL